MSLFQFPKTKHVRKQKPKKYKRYQSYKRWLQAEFQRLCVYCRQPDSSAANVVFGVDHYRPKGDPRFAALLCAYDNLLYCCNTCNSFKNDYWPEDELIDPFVVSPCEHEMANHLRFDAKTCKHEPRTAYGQFTEKLLHLNDEASVAYRKSALVIVRALENEIADLKKELKELEKDYKDDVIDDAEFNDESAEISEKILEYETARLAQTGEAALALNAATAP